MPPPTGSPPGGFYPLAEALAVSSPDSAPLLELADRLSAGPAVRRIGSLADRLGLAGLAGRLEPLAPPRWDLDLDPDLKGRGGAFRDARWRVRWPARPDAVAGELQQ